MNLINYKNIYECDPLKNTKCKKSWCYYRGHECRLTSKKECSIDGEPYYKKLLKRLSIERTVKS